MLPIALTIAILGLIWGVILFQRGGLIGGCLATIATGSCLGHPFFHVSVLTLDRAIFVGVGAAYVLFSRLAITKPKPWAKADLALAAFLILLLLSVFAHDWQLDGAQPVATLLFFYLMPVGLYWVARQTALREVHVLAVFSFLTALGVYLSVTAVAEVNQWWFLVFPKYIASPEHTEFFGRARGPYLNPVGNGFYLSACLAATLMWWPRVQNGGKAIVALAAAVILAAIYCTLTRSVWLGAGLGLLTLVGLSVPKRHRFSLLVLAALLSGSIIVAKWDRLKAFKRDHAVSESEMAKSAGLRPILAAFAWEMFRDRPLFGCGFGQYRQYSSDYLNERPFDLPMDKAKQYVQHNVFLSLLSETGITGMMLFIVVLAFWGRDAWHLWSQRQTTLWKRQQGLLSLCVLVAYLPNAMFHEMSIIPMTNTLLFFCAGLTRGVVLSERT